MLLIRCPYCGERPEIEFRHGGRGAHRAPARSGVAVATPNGRTIFTTAPIRRACTPSAGATSHGCGRFFNALRDTISDFFLTTYKLGEPRPDLVRLPAGNADDRVSPASRRPDRPQQAGCAFSFDGRAYEGFAGDTLASALHRERRASRRRARSSITGRAASSRPAPTSRTLWSPSCATGARCTPNLRATQVELYDGLVAESQNRWPSLALRSRRASTISSRR